MKPNIQGVCVPTRKCLPQLIKTWPFISTAGDLYCLPTACALLWCSYWFNK